MSDKIREVEVDDEEAERILATTRHRQIRQLFTKLIEAVQSQTEDKEDQKFLDEVKKQSDAIDKIASGIKNISVNVEVDQKETLSSLNKLGEDIIASNERLGRIIETRLLPDTFKLNKVQGGATDTVKVYYKPANQINS